MLEFEPKISIVVPTHNAEKTIVKCLSCLQNQTYENLEIICVDDCSDDSSVNIIKEIMKHDERIHIVENDVNSGTLITRKRGVEKATGDYILFADNDDWYELLACEKLVDEVKKDPTDIIMYSFNPVDTNEDVDTVKLKKMSKWGLTRPERIVSANCIFTENRMNLLWNKMVKASICQKAYSYVKDIYLTVGEDTYVCWLIHYFAKSFRTIPDILYNWNVATGVTARKKYSLEEFDGFCKCMFNFENEVCNFFREVCAREIVFSEFARGNDARIGSCIDVCVECVSKKEFPVAFNSIINYYGTERTLAYIQADVQKKNKKIVLQREKITELQGKKIRLNKSRSYQVGKVLTSPIRMLKRKKQERNSEWHK